MKKVLVTGSCGFIGFSLCNKLLDTGEYIVLGIDNINDYYNVQLKNDRLKILNDKKNFYFNKVDIEDKGSLHEVVNRFKPNIIVNLAARAGVRYSNTNKDCYIRSNILGFCNVLEEASINKVEHLIYASSSSVYGQNTNVPFKEGETTDFPESVYAATKKCDEVLAHAYSKINNIKVTGLRFFTVYGPFGRPDMAYFKFTKKLLNNETIEIYNNGDLKRDFTYIDDIVESIIRIIKSEPKEMYNIYNLGSQRPYNLLDFLYILKNELIKEKLLPENFDINEYIKYTSMQKGDVYETYSDTSKFFNDYSFKPETSLDDGLNRFVKWYKKYYKVGD